MDVCKEICQRQTEMEKARRPMFQQELEELRSKGIRGFGEGALYKSTFFITWHTDIWRLGASDIITTTTSSSSSSVCCRFCWVMRASPAAAAVSAIAAWLLRACVARDSQSVSGRDWTSSYIRVAFDSCRFRSLTDQCCSSSVCHKVRWLTVG